MAKIHEFDLKRADETMATERLFGALFLDQFDWLRNECGCYQYLERQEHPQNLTYRTY